MVEWMTESEVEMGTRWLSPAVPAGQLGIPQPRTKNDRAWHSRPGPGYRVANQDACALPREALLAVSY